MIQKSLFLDGLVMSMDLDCTKSLEYFDSIDELGSPSLEEVFVFLKKKRMRLDILPEQA